MEAAYQKGISKIQFGRFTGEDDKRLEELIINSTEIKLLMLNGSSFIQSFKTCLVRFADNKGIKMKVLLADENSEFYNENSMQISPQYDKNYDNKELVNRAVGRLNAIFIHHPEKLEVKKYNTQFRLPLIIFGSDFSGLQIIFGIGCSQGIYARKFPGFEAHLRINPLTSYRPETNIPV